MCLGILLELFSVYLYVFLCVFPEYMALTHRMCFVVFPTAAVCLWFDLGLGESWWYSKEKKNTLIISCFLRYREQKSWFMRYIFFLTFISPPPQSPHFYFFSSCCWKSWCPSSIWFFLFHSFLSFLSLFFPTCKNVISFQK